MKIIILFIVLVKLYEGFKKKKINKMPHSIAGIDCFYMIEWFIFI